MAAGELPQVGMPAVDFQLPDLSGKAVRLSERTAKSPVVIVVLRGYPGYQCPLCMAQVGEFLSKAKAFAEAKAEVLLVYPGPAADLDKHAKEFVGKRQLPEHFHLLVDADFEFVNAYGLRWDAPRETAYPSTFLVDQEGMIRFAKISKTHGGRTRAKDVLAEIGRLGSK